MSISPAWVSTVILVIAALFQLIGLVGLALVFFPGPTVAWIGQLIWAIYTRFNYGHASWQFTLTIVLFVVSTLLMLAGSFLDNLMMAGQARKQGSPWWEIGLSWVAMIIGGILLTPLGGLAAALLSVFLVEYQRLGKKQKEAWEATKQVALAWGWSTLIRVAIVLVMIALWVVMLVWL
ncbi:MAG TPA: DUF456 domain-containing protein [Anaerolineaceae bacterium]|jgi:uncharacterized protein YqgC (DUF456 family)|nr:DUF456 domain-containing protein [Anaerolineaceae bacterium]HOA22327.1 DUF456 domain-containing protein [Anaerolineaceae bacterium]HOG77607.1 DUF456 domain-containing protein [Anaerolineaceae bacterium]